MNSVRPFAKGVVVDDGDDYVEIVGRVLPQPDNDDDDIEYDELTDISDITFDEDDMNDNVAFQSVLVDEMDMLYTNWDEMMVTEEEHENFEYVVRDIFSN